MRSNDPNIMNTNQLKILFVGIMVVLAVAGRTGREEKVLQEAAKEAPRETNAIAAVQPAFQIPITRISSSLPPIPVAPAPPALVKKENVPEPQLNVKAAFAEELDTGEDFYRFNANLRWPLASLTKLMSAVIAIEEVGLAKKAAVSEAAVASEGVAGNLQAGERYSVGELLKLMLVVSSNDAAAAVAEFYGTQNFVNQMQIKASQLEMAQTAFADPAGLSSLNQGTVGDLEKLVRHIYKNYPAVFKTTGQPKISVFEETKEIEREVLNINPFAQSRTDFLGGKTGFIDESGGNIISIFNYNGHKILIIILGSGNKFEDKFNQTEILYNWIKEAYSF